MKECICVKFENTNQPILPKVQCWLLAVDVDGKSGSSTRSDGTERSTGCGGRERSRHCGDVISASRLQHPRLLRPTGQRTSTCLEADRQTDEVRLRGGVGTGSMVRAPTDSHIWRRQRYKSYSYIYVTVFTARCYAAVAHGVAWQVVRRSVHPSGCNVEVLWSHRWNSSNSQIISWLISLGSVITLA